MKLLKLFLMVLTLNSFIYASEEFPTKEEVAKLYVATFNRAPDNGGLEYWINNSGLKLSEIAQSFFDQTETLEKYPEGTTNRNFIKAVYNNLFNRDPDNEGWNYWEYRITNNLISKNRFIEAVINGALDNENGLDKTILDNKTEVGLTFANAGLNTNHHPEAVLQGITADKSTVTYIKEQINSNNLSVTVWDAFTNANTLYLRDGELVNLSLNSTVLNNVLITFSGTLSQGGQTFNVSGNSNFAEGSMNITYGGYSQSFNLGLSQYFPLSLGANEVYTLPSSINLDSFNDGASGTITYNYIFKTSTGDVNHTVTINY